MTTDAWLWALGLSVFAYWLGHMAGKRAMNAIIARMYFRRFGVRHMDPDGTIHFADGTKHTHGGNP